MKIFKLGMLGYGYWGKLLYRYFHQHPHFEILCLATRNPDKIEGNFPDFLKITTPDFVFECPDIEAIVIASSAGSHFKYLLRAIESEKHVFCEKPIVLKYKEAEYIKNLSEKKGIKIFVDYTLTFSPAIRKMLSLVREGAIGRIYGACFQTLQLGHFSENVYWDIGSHPLSILDALVPLDCLKFSRFDIYTRDGIVETGLITFREIREKPNGIAGSIQLSFNHPTKERKIAFYGELGTLLYNMLDEKPLMMTRYRVDRSLSRDPQDSELTCFSFDEFNTLCEVIQGFYEVLQGSAPTNIEMACRVTGTLEKLMNRRMFNTRFRLK